MSDDTSRTNLTITKDQNNSLDTLRSEYNDLDKSYITRRALAFYFREGAKRDRVLRDLLGKDKHSDVVDFLEE